MSAFCRRRFLFVLNFFAGAWFCIKSVLSSILSIIFFSRSRSSHQHNRIQNRFFLNSRYYFEHTFLFAFATRPNYFVVLINVFVCNNLMLCKIVVAVDFILYLLRLIPEFSSTDLNTTSFLFDNFHFGKCCLRPQQRRRFVFFCFDKWVLMQRFYFV